MSDIDTSTSPYLWEKFEKNDFQAFVYDFYYSLPDVDLEDATLGDVYNCIFGSDFLYREFLLFCSEQNYSFADYGDVMNSELELYLLAFETARSIVKHKTLSAIREILSVSESELLVAASLENIPGTDVSFALGLKTSMYKKIPVNSRGEVIYTFWKVEGGFEVYSHESGFHRVNTGGVIIWLEGAYTSERISLLRDIRLLQGCITILKSPKSKDPGVELLRYLWDNKKSYCEEKSEWWSGDTKQLLRFRMHLSEKLSIAKERFEHLKEVDHRFPALRIIQNNNET